MHNRGALSITPVGRRPLAAGQKVALGIEILVVFARVRWLVRRRDLPASVSVLRGGVQDAHDPDAARQTGYRLGGAVRTTLGRLSGDTRCLTQSLVLAALLARRGIHGTVVIGARVRPEFEAHAWVEYDGRALLPTLGIEPLMRL